MYEQAFLEAMCEAIVSNMEHLFAQVEDDELYTKEEYEEEISELNRGKSN